MLREGYALEPILANFVCISNKSVTKLKLTTKLKIVKYYIYSIFTYGCEAWTLSRVLEAKIEAFEMWYLRELRNVMWKDKVANESVLTKCKTKRQLLSDIQKRKLEYFGHIKRKKTIS